MGRISLLSSKMELVQLSCIMFSTFNLPIDCLIISDLASHQMLLFFCILHYGNLPDVSGGVEPVSLYFWFG